MRPWPGTPQSSQPWPRIRRCSLGAERSEEPASGCDGRSGSQAEIGKSGNWREIRTPAVNQRAEVSPSVWFGSPDVTLNETQEEPRVRLALPSVAFPSPLLCNPRGPAGNCLRG